MRVLLIKLTSMGDLIHALPALTDAQKNVPGIQFDWVVDEAFHEIALWHPAVNQVIKSAHRRWKKDFINCWKRKEIQQFYRQLHQHPYDLVLDAQNNLKSAVVTRLASRQAHGLDKNSVRESFAHLAYRHRYAVVKNNHAVDRLREYFSQVFNYTSPTTLADYGMDVTRFRPPEFNLPNKYLVFVHLASWPTKLWPDDHWKSLIQLALEAGYDVVLPSGSQEEQARSEALAKNSAKVHALPRLPLSEVAWIINRSSGVFSCDTGLCHLSAALNKRTVSFYGPTDVQLIGAKGDNQVHMVAEDFSCAPCYRKQCSYQGVQSDEAACMRSLLPNRAWQLFVGPEPQISPETMQVEAK